MIKVAGRRGRRGRPGPANLLEVGGYAWRVRVVVMMVVVATRQALASGGDAFEARQSGDAVRALCIERVGGGTRGLRGAAMVVLVGRGIAFVAVFDGGRGERGKRGGAGVWGASDCIS
jgi:hypothetical protein